MVNWSIEIIRIAPLTLLTLETVLTFSNNIVASSHTALFTILNIKCLTAELTVLAQERRFTLVNYHRKLTSSAFMHKVQIKIWLVNVRWCNEKEINECPYPHSAFNSKAQC